MRFYLVQKFERLRVFRDDLYPFLGGGNKGRKMEYIANDIYNNKSDAIVTTGGIQSNHCRAVAIFAAQNKMKCTLVLHGNKMEFFKQSGNAKVMRLSGATLVFVENANEISMKMDLAISKYQNLGLNPYYLWGGGHTLEGGLAYIDAIGGLKEYCLKNQWFPDYIFHASGTGSTQAGILAGLDKYQFKNTRVIGISVGRNSTLGTKIVSEFYKDLCKHYNISYSNNEVVLLDDYLMGGYGGFNAELKQLSLNSIKDHGFTLDTCYTGKAYYGMVDFIKRNNIENDNILFWHTGGVLNFLSEEE